MPEDAFNVDFILLLVVVDCLGESALGTLFVGHLQSKQMTLRKVTLTKRARMNPHESMTTH